MYENNKNDNTVEDIVKENQEQHLKEKEECKVTSCNIKRP